MFAYLIRRFLLVIPTLFGIMLVNFAVIQFAPGGPVEQTLAQLKGRGGDVTARLGGDAGAEVGGANRASSNREASGGSSQYRGARGLPPELIKEIEKLYGFDKPASERFVQMLSQYMTFDFGKSFYSDRRVVDLVLDKMPVSISLGLWTTLITYLVSIPLGVRKAVQDGSRFDVWSSVIVIVGYAIPGFLFAVLLIVLFAGGSYLSWFPLRGLTSEGYETFSPLAKVLDYLWHIILPTTAMMISGFATLTLLTKNSFLDEIRKAYVVTALAKGNPMGRVLYRHVFRNAMLIVIAGFPSAFISILFTSSLLIEIVFSLDGLGLLGFQAALTRDYPIMFASLYFFTLMGLLFNILGDVMYVIVDPRIDFSRRD